MEKKARPTTLKGSTLKMATQCGNLYITVACNGDKPMEVFAHLGKAGGCSNCQNEALTRSISLGLKYGIPVQEYVEELEGILCPNPNMWPANERVLSCPDGIATALRGYVKGGNEEG